MQFPKYWALGKYKSFWVWRWSDTSQADAQAQADEAARKLAERIGNNFRGLNRYGYPDRPLREPVLREIRGTDGAPLAVITRNSYGCLVLNTERVMFVDVDLPQGRQSSGSGSGLIGKLFGRPAPKNAQASVLTDAEQVVVSKATAWTTENPAWGWRVYRTKAGMRLLATHGLISPDDPVAGRAFESLDADSLYRRLCKTQKSYRARLTPKPWRIGAGNPRDRWPFQSSAAESRFAQWDSRYQAKAGGFATCELIQSVGYSAVAPEIQSILNAHDEACRVGSGLPLG